MSGYEDELIDRMILVKKIEKAKQIIELQQESINNYAKYGNKDFPNLGNNARRTKQQTDLMIKELFNKPKDNE
jgi:hypothetical protein